MKILTLLALPLLAAAADSPGKIIGDRNAPLVIEVYSDFECPACKTFHDGNLRPLIKDYVVPGKAHIVFHEFPLPMHKHSRPAAIWATAAARIGKYEEVSNKLFASVKDWSNSGKVPEAALSAVSAEQGKKLRALAADPSVAAEVQRDVDNATALGVNSTPRVYLVRKGQRIPLIEPNGNYNLIRRLIDGLVK